jgi:hypothetical protein
MARCTRTRVSSLTSGDPVSTRDTVEIETPATRATSFIPTMMACTRREAVTSTDIRRRPV